MARVVRFVLAKMKPGYRTHRIIGEGPRLQGGPWDYVERIEITDRQAYEQELASDPDGKRLLDELYSKYLIREYTTSIWTEMIE